MSIGVALRLTLTLLGAAAVGCRLYLDSSGLPTANKPSVDEPPPAVSTVRSQAGKALPRSAKSRWMPVPIDPPLMPPIADEKPIEMDASQASPGDADSCANLRIAHTSRFDGYLTAGDGQPLYMFAGDVTGASETACLDDCAREWPPFDVEMACTTDDLDLAAVARFHRQDGAWQTTYKGHPLYYRAGGSDTREVTNDGLDRHWFVARDYLAFLASARTFAPAGGTSMNDVFLTDGFGRTLYVCLEDLPRTPEREAISSCDDTCAIKRPVFAAPEMGRSSILPSAIDASDVGQLMRLDGSVQLMYRGWPLYYFSGDITAGSTEGHNDEAWRAIDPITFGIDPAPGLSN